MSNAGFVASIVFAEESLTTAWGAKCSEATPIRSRQDPRTASSSAGERADGLGRPGMRLGRV